MAPCPEEHVMFEASLERGLVLFFRIAIRRSNSDAALAAVRAVASQAKSDAMTSLRHKVSMG